MTQITNVALTGSRLAYTLWGMCRATKCSKCQKQSWAGCGAHVEQVLGDVPQAQRCHCREDKAEAKAAGAGSDRTGLLARLRGR